MLYIHIPYCHRKCTYCAFYSTPTKAGKDEYVQALCSELHQRRSELNHPIRTIYFGGGTPTILTPTQLQTLVTYIRTHFDLSQIEEVTIEANPEDLTPENLRQLARLQFFNRISIGVQSFQDTQLRLLNRSHTARQAINAISCAYESGFGNISIDLIYGQPRQTLADWAHDLETLRQLGSRVKHLSAYALTLEPGTMLHTQLKKGLIELPPEELVMQQYDHLQQSAHELGYHQYEISSYCQSGYHSRHNSRYWDRTPYVGIGAAAHSFDGHSRRWNVSDIRTYIQALNGSSFYYETEQLTPRDAFNEYLMTSLRTTAGISLAYISATWPQYLSYLQQKSRKYLQAGHLVSTPTALQPTPQGLLHADGIAADLFL